MKEDKQWANFLKGDKKALSYIFRNHYEDLYNYGLRLTQSHEIVDDSMQDMFLKLWKNRKNLGQVSYVKPYLIKTMRRHVIANLSFGSTLKPLSEIPESQFEIVYSYEDFLINEELDNETRDRLLFRLNNLSKKQKEAIHLRYFLGLGFSEISEIMSINIQSVRNHISKGLKQIKELNLLLLTTGISQISLYLSPIIR